MIVAKRALPSTMRASDQSWVFDKSIDGGCSKRRPDIFLDMGSEILIIEVDGAAGKTVKLYRLFYDEKTCE
jgi:hypothetical protein